MYTTHNKVRFLWYVYDMTLWLICQFKTDKKYVLDGVLEVTCIAFHHDVKEIILVGYGNGELRLYHTKQSKPTFYFDFSFLNKQQQIIFYFFFDCWRKSTQPMAILYCMPNYENRMDHIKTKCSSCSRLISNLLHMGLFHRRHSTNLQVTLRRVSLIFEKYKNKMHHKMTNHLFIFGTWISVLFSRRIVCSSLSNSNASIRESKTASKIRLLACDSKNRISLNVLIKECTHLHKKEKRYVDKLIQSYLKDYWNFSSSDF